VHRANVSGGGDQLLEQGSTNDRWYLMGYEPEGNVAAFAHLSDAGTEVVRTRLDSTVLGSWKAGPLSARGFTILPDGRPALLLLQQEASARVYRAVELAEDGSVVRLTAGGAEDTGIASGRLGAVFAGSVPDSSGPAAAAMTGVVVVTPPDGNGFDVPVAASPNGTFVVVEHFSGSSPDRPGDVSLLLIDAGGRRTPVTGAAQLSVAGWSLPDASRR
jgi:hypothetical protein